MMLTRSLACALVLLCGCSSSEGAPGAASPDAGDGVETGGDSDGGSDTGTEGGSDGEAPPEDGAVSSSSKGSGGLACTSTGSVTVDGASYSYCVAKVAGVELKIVEPAGASQPLHLALYFHGDGAGPYQSGLAIKKHAPWTSAHGVLYVAALAPNACSWWLRPSYTVCDANTPVPDSAIDRDGENAQAVQSVVKALRGGWDIADTPVLYGGSSGGSIFLAASFLPMHGDKHPGAYALSCGGDAPFQGQLGWDASNPSRLGATRLFFTYGDKDFVATDVQQAIAFYEPLGFPTDVKVIPETVAEGDSQCGNVGGSYSYDQLGRVVEVWSDYYEAQVGAGR